MYYSLNEIIEQGFFFLYLSENRLLNCWVLYYSYLCLYWIWVISDYIFCNTEDMIFLYQPLGVFFQTMTASVTDNRIIFSHESSIPYNHLDTYIFPFQQINAENLTFHST